MVLGRVWQVSCTATRSGGGVPSSMTTLPLKYSGIGICPGELSGKLFGNVGELPRVGPVEGGTLGAPGLGDGTLLCANTLTPRARLKQPRRKEWLVMGTSAPAAIIALARGAVALVIIAVW